MRKILLCTLVTAFLNTVTWAAPEPEKCPSIDAIQINRLDSGGKDQNGHYSACKTSYYDTQDKWTFIITNIDASSQDEAFKKAISALSTLSGNPKPGYINGYFGCRFEIGAGYYAYAYTAQPTICKK